MRPFTMTSAERADPPVRDILKDIEAQLGFAPHLFRVIALAPPALQAFAHMNNEFAATSLTPAEQVTVEIATSVENDCGYCVAGHSAFATAMKVPADVVAALRENRAVADPKLAALQHFTRRLIETRGAVSQTDLVHFFDAGFTTDQVIEVIFGVSLKTFSNFVGNSVQLTLDPAFEPYRWAGDEDTADTTNIATN